MKRKICITLLLLVSFVFCVSAERYTISPFSGALPSSSIKKVSYHQNSSQQNGNSKLVRTGLFICAVTVTVFVVYGIYKMKTTDSANCSDAYNDDCSDSLYCASEDFCTSLDQDCRKDITRTCISSVTENCNKNSIYSMFTQTSKLIPVYVR